MLEERVAFDNMLEVLMKYVASVNENHKGGVYFGTEHLLYPAEIHTVVIIGEHEGIGVTQLAGIMNISKPTLSERIRKLIKKGFVKKETNPVDRKAVKLWLTKDGKTACNYHEKHHQKMFEVFKECFKDVAGEKIKLFSETFNELARFEQSFDNYKK